MSWTSLQQEESKNQAQLEAGEAPCEPEGEDVQRLSVIQSLPQLLTDNETQCLQRVIPRVQQALPSASTEFQIAASSAFLTILEKKLVHTRTFTHTFLKSILTSLDSRDPVVANAWLETLLDVIELLPPTVIKTDILPIAIQKGQIAQSLTSRLKACRLLGKMATKFDSYLVKKELLPLIESLCQDVHYEVRASICSELHHVARALDADSVRVSLLAALIELANDEEVVVQRAAVETIAIMLQFLPQDSIKIMILPLVKKLCDQAIRTEDTVMVKITEHFGELCLGLERHLTAAEKSYMIEKFKSFTQLGNSRTIKQQMPDLVTSLDNSDNVIQARQNCAQNFPVMVMFCERISTSCFQAELYSTFCELTTDPYFMVRHYIACGFYKVAVALGPRCSILRPELIKLLRDDAEEVLQGLVPDLGAILSLFVRCGVLSTTTLDHHIVDIGRAVLKAEADINMTNNWRLHECILIQMRSLVNCLPSEFIYTYFVPVIFTRILLARPVPCRLAAVKTLLIFLRYNNQQAQKQSIRSQIDSDLRRGHSCYTRKLYVKLCDLAIDVFSRRYFKDYFFHNLLDLCDDSVPNIRLMVVALMPKMKAMVLSSGDHKLLNQLETSVRKLSSKETDRDVKWELNKAVKLMTGLENSSATLCKEDEADLQKFEEEQRLLASTTLGPSNGVSRNGKRRKSMGNGQIKGPVSPPDVHHQSVTPRFTRPTASAPVSPTPSHRTPAHSSMRRSTPSSPVNGGSGLRNSSRSISPPSSRDSLASSSSHRFLSPGNENKLSSPASSERISSCQLVSPANSILPPASEACICSSAMIPGFCPHLQHFSSPPQMNLHNENMTTCECGALNTEMHLMATSLLQERLLASKYFPIGEGSVAERGSSSPNAQLEDKSYIVDVYNIRGLETNHTLHDNEETTLQPNDRALQLNTNPAGILKFECKVYTLDGMPHTNHGLWPCHHPSIGASNPATTNTTSEVSESGARFIVSSLEDEFYVDAGIRIPQQLAASDFSRLPSRIPNLREVLFRNRSTDTGDDNAHLESHSLPQPSKQVEGSSVTETKTNYSASQKMLTKSNIPSISKATNTSSTNPKKSLIPNTVGRPSSGVFNAKADYQNPKNRLSVVGKQKDLQVKHSVSVTTSATTTTTTAVTTTTASTSTTATTTTASTSTTTRRHSYMEGEKSIRTVTTKATYNLGGRKNLGAGDNRRHSYIERVQVQQDEVQKSEDMAVVKRGIRTESRMSTNSISNSRRLSYNEKEQITGDSQGLALRKVNRHSVGEVTGRRRNLLYSQGIAGSGKSFQRGMSLERVGGGGDVTCVKRRSMIAPANSKLSGIMDRRHSSLERDDISLFSPTEENIDKGKLDLLYKMDPSLPEFLSASRKETPASKIPRSGGTSCHSSPGNSRASSPTGNMIRGNRIRQRTAPNSRASSPTSSAKKLQQRLSLGSLSCYMGNLKLSEPGVSRLPVRLQRHRQIHHMKPVDVQLIMEETRPLKHVPGNSKEFIETFLKH